jgi:hypothetical protein
MTNIINATQKQIYKFFMLKLRTIDVDEIHREISKLTADEINDMMDTIT